MRFEPKYGNEAETIRVTQELSWRSAFRIAWAIVIVNVICAVVAFLIATTIAAGLLRSFTS